MLYRRIIDIKTLSERKSLSLSENPGLLTSMVREIGKKHTVVVIDEIQKIPMLLDEVHNLIEAENVRFILTGSSARKLRKGGVNLLAGRAWECPRCMTAPGRRRNLMLISIPT